MSQTAMQKSLIDGLNEQFEKQEGSDVIFLVEETEIGAHKNVLAAQCKVLHDMAKDWTPSEKPIPVDAIDYESFKVLLRYLLLVYLCCFVLFHFCFKL